jgi:Ca2+-binding RTX toxin-like protein
MCRRSLPIYLSHWCLPKGLRRQGIGVQPVGGTGRAAQADVYGRLACTIRGTPAADHLVGTDHRDVICAGAGDDIVDGLGGRDVVYAGRGADKIYGRSSTDLLFGLAGTDLLNGGKGSDLCSDTAGTVRINCRP